MAQARILVGHKAVEVGRVVGEALLASRSEGHSSCLSAISYQLSIRSDQAIAATAVRRIAARSLYKDTVDAANYH
ncbi:MAG: hypothetical protein ACREUZ_07540 [Burkholderiales bacterium]